MLWRHGALLSWSSRCASLQCDSVHPCTCTRAPPTSVSPVRSAHRSHQIFVHVLPHATVRHQLLGMLQALDAELVARQQEAPLDPSQRPQLPRLQELPSARHMPQHDAAASPAEALRAARQRALALYAEEMARMPPQPPAPVGGGLPLSVPRKRAPYVRAAATPLATWVNAVARGEVAGKPAYVERGAAAPPEYGVPAPTQAQRRDKDGFFSSPSLAQVPDASRRADQARHLHAVAQAGHATRTAKVRSRSRPQIPAERIAALREHCVEGHTPAIKAAASSESEGQTASPVQHVNAIQPSSAEPQWAAFQAAPTLSSDARSCNADAAGMAQLHDALEGDSFQQAMQQSAVRISTTRERAHKPSSLRTPQLEWPALQHTSDQRHPAIKSSRRGVDSAQAQDRAASRIGSKSWSSSNWLQTPVRPRSGDVATPSLALRNVALALQETGASASMQSEQTARRFTAAELSMMLRTAEATQRAQGPSTATKVCPTCVTSAH